MSASSKKESASAPISIEHHRLPTGSIKRNPASVKSMPIGSLPKGTPSEAEKHEVPMAGNPHKVPAHELHKYSGNSKSVDFYPWFPPFNTPRNGFTGDVWQGFRSSRLEDYESRGVEPTEAQRKDIEDEFAERCRFADIDLWVMSTDNAPRGGAMVPSSIARTSKPAAIDPPRLEPHAAPGLLKSPRGAAAAAAKNNRKYGAQR